MSWSLEVAGSKDDVKAVVNSNTYIPDVLKADICARVNALNMDPWPSDPTTRLAYVKTHGHLDDKLGGSYEVNVRCIACALKPSPPPA